MRSIFMILLVFFCLSASAQSKDEQIILNTLENQCQAWNKGDINTFMDAYWHNDSLMFIGKNGVTYGWQNTLNNYKKGYPDTTAMGELNFTILHIKRLSVLYYSVVGKWELSRSIGNLSGHFTLLFKKIGKQWFIIADHSS